MIREREWSDVYAALRALPIGETVTLHDRVWRRHNEHWLADEVGKLFDLAAAANVTVHG